MKLTTCESRNDSCRDPHGRVIGEAVLDISRCEGELAEDGGEGDERR
jgi:hypothetical protein